MVPTLANIRFHCWDYFYQQKSFPCQIRSRSVLIKEFITAVIIVNIFFTKRHPLFYKSSFLLTNIRYHCWCYFYQEKSFPTLKRSLSALIELIINCDPIEILYFVYIFSFSLTNKNPILCLQLQFLSDQKKSYIVFRGVY